MLSQVSQENDNYGMFSLDYIFNTILGWPHFKANFTNIFKLVKNHFRFHTELYLLFLFYYIILLNLQNLNF